ncbi:MAG: TIGR01777 family protein [Acidobacteria bacterium]|nr:TIGR01777 family protein [Acidobacteriota bacterium]
MRVLISGSSGLVGTALMEALTKAGHSAHRLVRPVHRTNFPDPGDVSWDSVSGTIDKAAAEGSDAVVHLAGASIAAGRWSEARKHELRSSRVDATRSLVSCFEKVSRKPGVLISASAIGFYGSRGEEGLTEQSAPGADFLGILCRQWEGEAARAEELGIRTVMLRFGIILSPNGGALAKMLTPFKLGLGGRLGSGKQWMSWLTLPEVVSMIRFAIDTHGLSGPVNAVSPNPARNSDFTKALAAAVHRPAIFPAPPFALRLALGEMADALLLSSQRVLPTRLQSSGYRFLHPELSAAFRAVLSPHGR